MTAIPEPQVTDSASAGDASLHVYFVADAHLGIESVSVERTKESDLVAFLHYLRGKASALYMLGDIFDFWFEYKTVSPHGNFDVVKAIRDLSDSGTSVFFLGGNHDYWVGEHFEAMTGAKVHRDPLSDTRFDMSLLVAHGDGLPRGDLGYKFLKSILRSRFAIACFGLLHPTIGAALGRWASGLSKITEERIRRAIPSTKEFLDRKLTEGYDLAIVGHIHRQMVWKYERGTAAIVGDWMKNRSVVELTPGGVRPCSWINGRLVDAKGSTE